MTTPKPGTPLVDAAAERGSDLGAANEWASGIWPLARRLEQDRARLIGALKELREAQSVPFPHYEDGINEQHQWNLRVHAANKEAVAILRELGELE